MDDELVHELECVLRKKDATFDELIDVIETATVRMEAYKVLRERAIVAADKTGPWANRKAMGEAAHLYPSSLGRVLERHGRPTNRREGI